MKSGAPQADNVPAMGACGPCGAGAGRSSARNRRNAAPGNASPILQPAFGRSASSTRRPARAKPAAATAPAGPAPATTMSHSGLFMPHAHAAERTELLLAGPACKFDARQLPSERFQLSARQQGLFLYRLGRNRLDIDDIGEILVVFDAGPRLDDAKHAEMRDHVHHGRRCSEAMVDIDGAGPNLTPVECRESLFARRRGVDHDGIVVLVEDPVGHPGRPESGYIGVVSGLIAGAAHSGVALPWQRHPAGNVARALRI